MIVNAKMVTIPIQILIIMMMMKNAKEDFQKKKIKKKNLKIVLANV